MKQLENQQNTYKRNRWRTGYITVLSMQKFAGGKVSYAYKAETTQSFLDRTTDRKLEFCDLVLQKYEDNLVLLRKFKFLDECVSVLHSRIHHNVHRFNCVGLHGTRRNHFLQYIQEYDHDSDWYCEVGYWLKESLLISSTALANFGYINRMMLRVAYGYECHLG